MLGETFHKTLWFILLVCSSKSNKFTQDDTQLHVSTTKMISRFIEESKRSNVLVSDVKSEILENWIGSHDDLEITVDLNDLNNSSIWKIQKIESTILHIGSYTEFELFFRQIRMGNFLYDGHFIIIYEEADDDKIEKIFSKFWKAYIYNVNVLVTNVSSPNLVSVFTFLPFRNDSCGNTNPIQINEFDKSTMKWTTNEFYPKKFEHLNGCPLRLGCYENNPDFIMHRDDVRGSTKIVGVIVDIATMISNLLNFTLKLTEYEQGTGIIFANKTATDLLNRLLKNEVDLIFGSLQTERVDTFSATRTVQRDATILVIPPPYSIDPMTKIFLPFTTASWITIGMVGLSACCVVKVLKFCPKIVRDYVIGSNVKGSLLNVWSVFLGGTQKILPRSNFPRFLLAKFLIFTLIMRTLYQGGVFHVLKEDVNTVGLDTFDEFIEHEFTFYIYQSLARRLAGTKLTQRFVQRSNTKFI